MEAPKPARYVLVLGRFTAGLLFKSIVVTLPVSLLIWHWWRSGRVTRTELLRVAPLFALAVALTRISHQVAMRKTKKDLFLSISANCSKAFPGQPALGARSLVFSPSARTCFLKRSHHYAFGREHALRAKILRDRHAPW